MAKISKQVLAFSFDRATVPTVNMHTTAKNSCKLTMGWYNKNSHSAVVTTNMLHPENAREVLNDPSMQKRYKAGNVLFSLEKKILIYSLNNRDWLITICVANPKKLVDPFTFSSLSPFSTQSNDCVKIYAAWLMTQFSLKKMLSLRDMLWADLYDLFSKINEENPCTIILNDGQDMVFYQGSDFSNALYYVRSCPPHDNEGFFSSGHFDFQLDALDLTHTFTLVSSVQIQHKDSKFFNLNQMMVISSGVITWDKDPNAFWDQKLISPTLPQQIVPRDYLQKTGTLKLTYTPKSQTRAKKVYVPSESLDCKPKIYSITHKTCYEYDSPVYLSKHLFRLQPNHDLLQSLLEYELTVLADGKPVKSIPTNFVGAFGNHASFIEIDEPYKQLEVTCHSIVSIADPTPRRFDLLQQESNIPLIWMPWDRIMMQAYLIPTELPESELRELSAYALSFVKRNNHNVYEVLNDINRTIYQDYTYSSGSTSLATTAYEVYVNHRGVCQDFANLFICLARLLNIPARYRTGYVYTAADYENQLQGDASHAWLEVFLPYIGWQGFDPTNYCLAEKNHIRLACGRTFSDTAPTSGTIYRGGGLEDLFIDVKVILLNP